MQLSPREMTVLLRLAGGMTERQIAEDLDLSASTVAAVRSMLRAKLQAANSAQLVARAFELKLLASDEDGEVRGAD